MKQRHVSSKYDDATWRGLFRRWHGGETSAALKAEAGVSHDTWTAHATRLKMRIKDLPADDPARRRVPAFAGRGDDYQHPNSLLNECDWLRVMALRAARVPGALLAKVFGVAHSTICSQAKARGLPPPGPVETAARPERGFVFDPDNPEVTRRSLATALMKAIGDGRYKDAKELRGCWTEVERHYREERQMLRRLHAARGASLPGRGPC